MPPRAVQMSLNTKHGDGGDSVSSGLAALANLAPSFKGLDPYAASRCVSLLELVGKRYHRLYESHNKSLLPLSHSQDGGQEPERARAVLEEELLYTEDLLRMVRK